MNIDIPLEAETVIEVLKKNNYEAYVVGGCVRDSLLGLMAKDWDITTNATPENIINIFDKTIPTGLKHGTITVVVNNMNLEVTTYRIDGEYSDGRHPDKVIFTKSLVKDLGRRDFTINAMAYNYETGIYDPYDGENHLFKKLIKCVGDPDLRFKEDALRMLRAIRFSSQLNFTIDHETLSSICRKNHLIEKISSERIKAEFCKILQSPMPSKGLILLQSTGLLKYIIPELEESVSFNQRNPHHDKNIFDHLLSVVDNSENILKLRLAALFHDIGKTRTFSVDEKGIGHFYNHDVVGTEMTEAILKRLKFDNETINSVCLLISSHMTSYTILDNKSLKKLISKIGSDNLDDLFKLQIADTKGHAMPHDFSTILLNKRNAEKIIIEKQPLAIRDLNITGNDLISLGIPRGKKIGLELNRLLEIVLANPELNTREKLYELSTQNISKA